VNGVERIAAERKRQIEKEGFTAEHDEGIPEHNLARAAACYALPEKLRNNPTKSGETRIPLFDFLWPWNLVWWKPTPKNRIRELEKAGALIAAEIDRLLRLEKTAMPELDQYEQLTSILENINEGLDEYQAVSEVMCPYNILPFKKAQAEIEELIHDMDVQE